MNNQSKKFSIKSHTYTLFQGNDKEYLPIFGDNKKYVVPIFQRPYSWTEKELEPFMNDIFKGFWGIERDIKNQEPMFIGTMQLSDKNEVIDGQQRITTLTILLRILQLRFPEYLKLSNIKIDWLKTEVNSGKQGEYLNEFLSQKEITDKEEDTLNPYLKNACLIKSYFEENIQKEEDNQTNFSINSFCEYIFTQVYFVVIETCAGLSKTLQIFKAINTTGLDLNGGDLFKIRMYEYLKDIQKEDNSAFEKISAIYQKIDEKNREHKKNVNIQDILRIYQTYLIAKYKLPNVLFDFGVDSFYDRLFNTLLNIKQEEHFKNLNGLTLQLEELDKFIDAVFEWQASMGNKPEYKEGMLAFYMIWWSRYGKFSELVYQFLYKYPNDFKNMYKMMIGLSKIFFIYSICHAKRIGAIHSSFMSEVTKLLVNEDMNKIFEKINSELLRHKNSEPLKNVLSGYITDNTKKRNLICALSTYFQESDKNIEEIQNLLFENGFDIEHIHATNDATLTIDITLQNSIGNLTYLEQKINRSISDKTFADKKIQYQKQNSAYTFIKALSNKAQWKESDIKNRRDEEVNKIMEYLFK